MLTAQNYKLRGVVLFYTVSISHSLFPITQMYRHLMRFTLKIFHMQKKWQLLVIPCQTKCVLSIKKTELRYLSIPVIDKTAESIVRNGGRKKRMNTKWNKSGLVIECPLEKSFQTRNIASKQTFFLALGGWDRVCALCCKDIKRIHWGKYVKISIKPRLVGPRDFGSFFYLAHAALRANAQWESRPCLQIVCTAQKWRVYLNRRACIPLSL